MSESKSRGNPTAHDCLDCGSQLFADDSAGPEEITFTCSGQACNSTYFGFQEVEDGVAYILEGRVPT